MYREVSSFKFLPDGAIERCPQQFDLNGLRIYRTYRNLLDGLRSCQAAIETNSKKNFDGSKL